MTKDKDTTLRVTFSDETVLMHSALISGKMDNFLDSYTSVYCGPLDLEEIHTALFFMNRAVIKLLVSEFGIWLDSVDDFLLSAMTEALTKEYNVNVSGDSDVEFQKKIRFRTDSQY